jgi:hypothetical protein
VRIIIFLNFGIILNNEAIVLESSVSDFWHARHIFSELLAIPESN